MSLAVYKTLA